MTSPDPYDAFRSQTHFTPLDGIRAAAVTAVFFAHVYPPTFLEWFDGARGVRWFFVLSGFLITTLSLREEERRGAVDIGGFMVRRIFRILPLYYLALLVYFVTDVTVFSSSGFGVGWSRYWPWYISLNADIPYHLGWERPPLIIAWSLGVEEKFYLVWPVVGFLFFAGRRALRLAFIGGAFAAITVIDLVTDNSVATLLLPFQTTLTGCGIALLLHERRWFERLAVLRRPAVCFVLVLLAVVPLEGLGLGESPAFSAAEAVVLALALGAIVLSRTRSVALLGAKPAVWLGRRSYAFYLFHILCLHVVAKVADRAGVTGEARTLVLVLAAYPLTLVVAHAAHTWFEQPLILRGRRYASRSVPPPEVPADR